MAVTDDASVTTRNISALILLKIAQYPFLILFFLLVPRLMGANHYGEYALFISIIMIASSLTGFGGASEIFPRFVPEFKTLSKTESVNKIFGNLLFLQNIISFILGICLFLVLYVKYEGRFSLIYYILIFFIIVIRNNYAIHYNFLFGLNDLAKSNALLPLRRFFSLVFILILFYYFGLIGAIISTLIVDVCISIPALYWTRNYLKLKYLNFDLKFLKPFLMYGLVFYLCGGLYASWQKMGNVLIDHMTHSSQEVAIYDLANQFFLLIIGFILAINFAFAPIFTKLLLEGKSTKLYQWSSQSAKYQGILCTLTFFGFMICGDKLIAMTLGPDFQNVYVNCVIQLVGIFPLVIAFMGILFSIVHKEPLKYLAALAIGILCLLSGAMAFIPRYGANGCAMAAVVSCFAQAGVMLFLFKQKLFQCVKELFKTICYGLLFIPAILARPGLVGSLALFFSILCIYLAILFYAKLLTADELRDIFTAIRKKSVSRL
jgi:O-antigen/teichoic acid export membrane protein